MGRRHHRRPHLVRCVVCNALGRPVRRWGERPTGGWVVWSPPERWVCFHHAQLKPGQWEGARRLLARTTA
jgi:hypothetical protein